jgi:2-phosphosulfolactate phosphatase
MVDVAFTRAEAREEEVTVVIDVLRATSTIVQALDAGYRRVLCAASLGRARELAAPGRVLAGERHCERPSGFQLGNSPSDTIPPAGDELVLATTNGAPSIVRAASLSPVVLIACLLNLDAVVAAIGDRDVQLLCSGTDGHPALEDVYAAGRIASRLPGPATDAALIACAVARAYPEPRAALAASADAQVLRSVGLEADVDWCARESVTTIVPQAAALTDDVAVVARTHREASKETPEHLARNL